NRLAVGGEEPEIGRNADEHHDRALAVCRHPGGGAAPLLRLLETEVAANGVAAEQARQCRGRWRVWRRGSGRGRLSEKRSRGSRDYQRKKKARFHSPPILQVNAVARVAPAFGRGPRNVEISRR